jgi:hypothetical protein
VIYGRSERGRLETRSHHPNLKQEGRPLLLHIETQSDIRAIIIKMYKNNSDYAQGRIRNTHPI